jgi:hypothetical protein
MKHEACVTGIGINMPISIELRDPGDMEWITKGRITF